MLINNTDFVKSRSHLRNFCVENETEIHAQSGTYILNRNLDTDPTPIFEFCCWNSHQCAQMFSSGLSFVSFSPYLSKFLKTFCLCEKGVLPVRFKMNRF